MSKFCLIIAALAFVALANGQQNGGARPEESGAAEPYSYGYETDTHSAAEQRDPNGAVTGFYTLTDADGRQRRVEYVADEAGFRAKVQTNEVGTKSQNSADVEVLASPPTEGQLIYQAAPQQQVVQVQRQQTVATQGAAPIVAPQPIRSQQFVREQYYQQPGYSAGYGYYPGSAYGGYGSMMNGVYQAYPYGYGSNYGYYQQQQQPGVVGYNQRTYSSYNNHLPSSYYKALGGQQVGGGVARYVTTTTTTNSAQPAAVQTSGGYRSFQTLGGYQTLGAPQQTYQTGYVPQGAVQGRSSSLTGSSNYIVLKKKREDSDEKKNN